MDTNAGKGANNNTNPNQRREPIPYRRRFVTFAPGRPGESGQPGVRVASIEQDHSPFNQRYEPGNKDADARGYVKYPNVDLSIEYVNMLEASRAYEANVTLMETTKAMINSSLRLI